MNDHRFGTGPTATELARSNRPLREQIAQHFLTHHYPPVPMALLQTAVDAITSVNKGHPNAEIALPEGMSIRSRPGELPTAQIITQVLVLTAWKCDCKPCREGDPHWGL